MKTRKKLGRWFVLAFALFALYILFAGPEGVLNIYRYHQQAKKAELDLRQAAATIDSLKIEIELKKNDTLYIEKFAREKLGMARKDERVYKFSK